MIINFIYIILSILGLSFLIFIHELGHYWMARRVGMRVETFAIGFGKPIYSWMKDGTKWQIGWLPFGGYVKIAGTETSGDVDPYKIPDGFFGKSPWDRLKVAFMGPFVNLVFAFVVFAALWGIGGRNKSFSELTRKIGWVDPKSELYANGVRPGDEILGYDDYLFKSQKDHVYAPMITGEQIQVRGNKVNYSTGEKTSFEYTVNTYPHPSFLDKKIMTAGILNSGSYVIYERMSDGRDNPLVEGSPMKDSGIQYGDRLIWVDGEIIFSNTQLSDILNDGRILLTIQRGDAVLLRRVPRVPASQLRPDAEFKEEMVDWQHEAGLSEKKFQELFVIPYNLSFDCKVENQLRFVDEGDQKEAFPAELFSPADESLREGDKILAAQGVPVGRAFELLKEIQAKRINIIVEREPKAIVELPWNEVDDSFYQYIDMNQLARIANSIGTEKRVSTLGNLALLKAVIPKSRGDFPMTSEAKAWLATEKLERLKEIEAIEDSEKRTYLKNLLETSDNLLVLGVPNPQDRKVIYNPKPTEQFLSVATEIWRTLQALLMGSLSPKYISGPVGIVQVVQSTSMVSLREALFWIGAISLNLGVLNLLPIPILDGGTIVFSFVEMITGRRIKPKILEKVIFVFAILLISFFLFLTYNDVLRVFGNFLG